MVICAGLVPVCSAGTTTRTREVKRLKDLTLLDKYAATQDKFNLSFSKGMGNFILPVSKFDAELYPRGQDILFGIEADMAKHFLTTAVVKNLSWNLPDLIFRSRCTVVSHVNIPYLKFRCILGP